MNQEEFYSKIPEWIEAPKSSWNHITLMAYFCHKYEVKNGVRFRLVRWKQDPGKGKESRDFSRLFKILAPENYSLLSKEEKSAKREEVNVKIYNYINWMFDFKFRRGERSVTGTQIFLMPAMINEFERMYADFLRKKKNAGDIRGLISWIKDNAPLVLDDHEIEDVNDIKMLQRYVEAYSLGENSPEFSVVKRAKSVGII